MMRSAVNPLSVPKGCCGEMTTINMAKLSYHAAKADTVSGGKVSCTKTYLVLTCTSWYLLRTYYLIEPPPELREVGTVAMPLLR